MSHEYDTSGNQGLCRNPQKKTYNERREQNIGDNKIRREELIDQSVKFSTLESNMTHATR